MYTDGECWHGTNRCFLLSRHFVHVGVMCIRLGCSSRVTMKCKQTTKQNELAEAKGGRSEARHWVCRMVAFEGACLALEGYGTVEAEKTHRSCASVVLRFGESSARSRLPYHGKAALRTRVRSSQMLSILLGCIQRWFQ